MNALIIATILAALIVIVMAVLVVLIVNENRRPQGRTEEV